MALSVPANAALPCLFSRYSRRLGRALPLRPAVDCEGRCAGCPWNRAEKLRRRAEGRWRRGADGLLRLHFVPLKSDDKHKEDTV